MTLSGSHFLPRSVPLCLLTPPLLPKCAHTHQHAAQSGGGRIPVGLLPLLLVLLVLVLPNVLSLAG